MITLPATAMVGWGFLIRQAWMAGAEGRDLLLRTIGVALPSLASLVLLFWQVRAGPAAQMMALPGATALVVLFVAKWMKSPSLLMHAAAVVLAVFAFGAAVPVMLQLAPDKPKNAAMLRVAKANNRCPSLAALAAGQSPA